MFIQFVSRGVYEDMKTLLATAEQRYTALLEKYHALKLMGAAQSDTHTIEEPVMPPEILMRAIKEVSPQQDHAYLMNYQWAMALKDHWQDEGKMRDAAQQIRYGAHYDHGTETDA